MIQNCIEKAVKDIKKKTNKEIGLEINIDRDTANRSGSPSIVNTIFQKIKQCDIFICDITIVNNKILNRLFNYRLSPNPNVLIELGYAANLVGWERIICINDIAFSKPEDLPFDIRGHRITSFESAKENHKKDLTSHLKHAIESVISNYDKIIADQAKDSHKLHDLNIYSQINKICSEQILIESISRCVDSLITNQFYLDHWDNLKDFYKLSINLFIDNDLDDLMKRFLQNLDSFDTIVLKDFHLDDRSNPEYLKYSLMTADGVALTSEQEFDFKQMQTYKPVKYPFPGETWPQADTRIHNLQKKLFEQGKRVKQAYTSLVMKVKQTLL